MLPVLMLPVLPFASRTPLTCLPLAVLLALVAALSPVSGRAQDAAPPTLPATTAPGENPYVWDLTDLFATTAAWQASHDKAKTDIAGLANLQGTLDDGAQDLLNAADRISQVYKDVLRLVVYATLRADEDTRISANEERRQMAQALLADFGKTVSWFDPELLDLGARRLERYLRREEGLDKHRFAFENTLRAAEHTLDEEAEALIAGTALMARAPNTTYDILTGAELSWPEIRLSGRRVIRLDKAAYSKYRQEPDRGDRELVFDTFWSVWKRHEQTLGSLLNAHLQGLKFQTEARKFPSSLARALFPDNMPGTVYQTLVEQVNAALPTLHRYFRLRARMLEIEGPLAYYDVYAPLVSLEKTFTIEDSMVLTREALAPLGGEYLAAYDRGIEGRWMHVFPKPGKRSGAYMFGAAYDVHPYVLLNHNNDYESLSTFAHEYGHAVHSVLASASQPWETASYATFIAETASIMNEMLLQDLMVEKATSDEERLFYLGNGLESLRGTYFRQTMFAEFELAASEAVDRGDIMTGPKFTQIYGDLLRRYHGHNEGILKIDEAYAVEWAFVPHFYYDFYVYQYATSIAAAAGLAASIGEGDEAARDRFITMLKAGGSDHPYTLMKAAGVDLAAPAPYKALQKRMNTIMDEMEEILDSLGR